MNARPDLVRSPRGHRRRAAIGAAVLASLVTLAGCSSIRGGAYELPLPGGADVGDAPITIEAEFVDVLDLVPHSSVKLDDVDVGQVTDIELTDDGRSARVTMEIRGDLDLTTDAAARIEQSSLLGEKFVALSPGTGGDPLATGDELGLSVTSQAVDAEQVLGALSMLLTGGGVAQFQEISRELAAIGGGRTPEIRAFIEDVDAFVSTLNAERPSISATIDRMGELSRTLNDNRDELDDVLTRLSPGLEEIAAQRVDLVRMLEALDELSDVTVQILNASGDDMVVTLRQLDPVLRQLARSGRDLPRSWEILFTFPFTDAVLDAVKGDYLNAFITMSIVQTATAQPGTSWPYGSSRSVPPVMLNGPSVDADTDADTDSDADSDTNDDRGSSDLEGSGPSPSPTRGTDTPTTDPTRPTSVPTPSGSDDSSPTSTPTSEATS